MTNNLTAQTAIEFENVLKNHIISSEGAQKVYLAVQPFFRTSKKILSKPQ